MVAQKWWAYNVEGKHTNMTTMEGPEYEAWKMQHSMKGKSMSKVIKDEVGFNKGKLKMLEVRRGVYEKTT